MVGKAVKAKVIVRDRDFPGFLDMLRYDACTVLSWDRLESTIGRERFEITLASNTAAGFTNERWASFGLTLKEVS